MRKVNLNKSNSQKSFIRNILSTHIENIIRGWLSYQCDVLPNREVVIDKVKFEFDAICNFNGITKIVEIKTYVGGNEHYHNNATEKTSRFANIIVIEASRFAEMRIGKTLDYTKAYQLSDGSIKVEYNIFSVLKLGVDLRLIRKSHYRTWCKRINDDFFVLDK